MKKALSLILALTMAASISVTAFAAEETYEPGDSYLAYSYDPAYWWNYDLNDQLAQVDGWDTYPFGPMATLTIVPGLNPVDPTWYYIVQPGDNENLIALNFYGDIKAASGLIAANKDHHYAASGGILEAFRAYRLPGVVNGINRLPYDWEYIEDRVADGAVLYAVQKGDTLAGIASKFYNGRTDFVSRIMADEWNRDHVKGTTIYEGQWLILPVVTIVY